MRWRTTAGRPRVCTVREHGRGTADMSISVDFEHSTAPFRGELLAHCYRMLGSVHDAEDVLQETLVRAWRAKDRYDEGRASLRTWLYRIATNACLTALESRSRRPLPTGLVGPTDDPQAPLTSALEVPWLQPFPDASLGTDPAAVAASRGSLRLALIAAMQLLPARQRAILILRDVLEWSAAEVADTLSTTVAAVNSGLQRARASLAEAGVSEEQLAEPDDPGRRAILDRYAAAFESADIEALTRLLTEDVILEMPPVLNWYVGRRHYGEFMARVFTMRGADWRVRPLTANGQPALAAYARNPDGAYEARTLQVFTIGKAGISHDVVFADPSLFPAFGLPVLLDAAASRS
ncbi:sigma-70 family RNA polymerase sigma factor [Phytohabitans kaempferiae]|uniref:RNA polymerase sigma factor n=1 Tax=Phytohabitans kaempferiae TaxID=1620943 RepID=A0ABV6M5A0_9ACTN